MLEELWTSDTTEAGTVMIADIHPGPGSAGPGPFVTIDGILLSHPDGFRIAISYGCTPVVPAIFIVSLLTVGLQLTVRERMAGLAIGLTLITLLNLFRVAALYYIGVATPHAFAVAHEWLGEAVIVVGTAAVVAHWIRVAASAPLATNGT